MLFVYFLRNKVEASQTLKAFLADVAPFGHVSEMHSDNGTKCTSKTFQHILHDKCIKHTSTAPYSPFQNGKSERSWRSLMDMARCLLADALLPKFLWSYAVRHAQYLKNRSYQRRTRTTAHEIFLGTKPDMRHVHQFGAPCTIFVESHKQKFSARGQKGTFIGVNPKSQGHYILNRANNIVTNLRNVHIHDVLIEADDHSHTVPPQGTATAGDDHSNQSPTEKHNNTTKNEYSDESFSKTSDEPED